jgi:hypothetical protein
MHDHALLADDWKALLADSGGVVSVVTKAAIQVLGKPSGNSLSK